MILISSAANLYTHKSRRRSKTVEASARARIPRKYRVCWGPLQARKGYKTNQPIQVRDLIKALDDPCGCEALEEGCLGCRVVLHSHFKYGTYHHGPLLNGTKGRNCAKLANADHNWTKWRTRQTVN